MDAQRIDGSIIPAPQADARLLSPASVYEPRLFWGRHLSTCLRADSCPRFDAHLQWVGARLHTGVGLQAAPFNIEPVSVCEPLHFLEPTLVHDDPTYVGQLCPSEPTPSIPNGRPSSALVTTGTPLGLSDQKACLHDNAANQLAGNYSAICGRCSI